jgi:hypothetical protein
MRIYPFRKKNDKSTDEKLVVVVDAVPARDKKFFGSAQGNDEGALLLNGKKKINEQSEKTSVNLLAPWSRGLL